MESSIVLRNNNSLLNLLSSSDFIIFEESICQSNNCILYNDNSDLLIQIVEKTISLSEFRLHEIVEFINNNISIVKDLSNFMIKKFKIRTISIGFTISYAIYLIYLMNGNDEALLGYLEKLRIPRSKKFLSELKLYFSQCNINS